MTIFAYAQRKNASKDHNTVITCDKCKLKITINHKLTNVVEGGVFNDK